MGAMEEKTTTDSKAMLSRLRLGAVAVTVSDLEESVMWYQEVLGMEDTGRGGFETVYQNRPVSVRVAFLEGCGTSISLICSSATGRKARPDPASHLFTPEFKSLILHTDDFLAMVEHLRTSEVDFLWDNMVHNNGMGGAVFVDPNNNLIEVLGPPGQLQPGELGDLESAKNRDYPPTAENFSGKGAPRLIANGVVLANAH